MVVLAVTGSRNSISSPPARKQLRGNIYLAKVTRVEPSLQAAFVDYGGNRHGFLAFSEIHPDYYQIPVADRQALLEEEARAHARGRDEAAERATQPPPQPSARRNERELRGARRDEAVSSDPLPTESDLAERQRSANPSGETDAGRARSADRARASRADGEEHAGEADTRRMPRARRSRRGARLDRASRRRSRRPDRERQPIRRGADDEPSPSSPTRRADAHEDDDEPTEATTLGDGAGRGRRARAAPRRRGRRRAGRGRSAATTRSRRSPRRAPRLRRQYKIQEVIKRRQVLLVQVVKEERGNKGAALTTYLSLAGRYSVLMPNTARGGGISRKITNAADRKRLKAIAQELEVPEGMGVILRTAGAAPHQGRGQARLRISAAPVGDRARD